ncbi:MAG TPA: aminopeptidase N [Acidothermaceae bacterium]
MPGNNLSRDEATERARLIGPVSGEAEPVPALETIVFLDLTSGAAKPDHFLSSTTIRFSCREPGASTFVDLVADEIRSITLNGVAIEPATNREADRLRLSNLAEHNELEIVAECRYMHSGEGMHRFTDPVDGRVYLYTQFETADAHRVYACFDQPDLKTTFELDVIAPGDWQVVSVTAPDVVPEQLAENPDTTTSGHWHFPPTPPLSTYVTSVIAGPYHVVHDVHHGVTGDIPLGVYCRLSLATYLDADDVFLVTKQGFAFFEQQFARPYPFGKYDQLFVPEFNAGAMENAGSVTFLEDYVFRSRVTDTAYEGRAGTILHEMAHMWFGDLVTMRWWDDLWLNESFATYMANLATVEATRWPDAWTTFANEEKTWACRQDQLTTTHPIAADIVDIEAVETNFDGITYAKGAAVLKQLVAWVGRDAFFAGLRRYFDDKAWGNSTLHDLLRALESASGRDLSAWSKEWLESAGINTLRPEIETDAQGLITSFAVLQEAPADHPTLRSHRLAIGFYNRTDAGLDRTNRIELDVVGARTEVAELIGTPRPDLVLVNDDDLAYAKIRLDARSLVTVTDAIGELNASLPRALCWAAAWDMTRDAEMAARDYVRLVIHLLDTETDIGVLQSVLRQARLAVERWSDPDFRDTGLDAIAAACHAHLHGAEPGSDYQLTLIRALAATANSPTYVDVVASVLAGETEFAGLALDTDLRWSLLGRLAAHGRVGTAEIDAELERDNTAAGRRHAAAVRAALPDPAAKELAWAAVMENDDTHNAELSAIIIGFQQPSQLALLATFRQRYFDELAAVWRDRTGDTARTIAEGMFPYLVIDQSTIDLVDNYLETSKPPSGLRRILLEHQDTMARALRARARDTAAATAAAPTH